MSGGKYRRCEQVAKDADERDRRCIRPAGHNGYHWYDDWRAGNDPPTRRHDVPTG